MGNSDSKAAFASGVQRLKSATIADDDTLLWKQLIDAPADVQDVFSMIQPDDLRHLRQYQPRNLAKLILMPIRELRDLKHTVETKKGDTPDAAALKRAMNSVRLLTRVMPILFEDLDDAFTINLFWNNTLPHHSPPTDYQEALVAQQEGPAEGKPAMPSPPQLPPETEGVELGGNPLGREMMHLVMHTLFTPGLTVDPAQYKLWLGQLEEFKAQSPGPDASPMSSPSQSPDRKRTAPRPSAVESKPSPASPLSPSSEVKDVGSPETATSLSEGSSSEEDATPARSPDTGGEEGTEDDTTEDDGSEGGSSEDDGSEDGSEDASEYIASPGAEDSPLTNTVWSLLLWSSGVGFSDLAVRSSSTHNLNRVEVLRLLMVCCSETLYSEPNPLSPYRSRFVDVLVSATCPFAPTLFYCLLNNALSYDPYGWGIPYASSLVTDTLEPLADMSLQTLTVLLDYAPIVTETVMASPESRMSDASPSPVSGVGSGSGAGAGAGAGAGSEPPTSPDESPSSTQQPPVRLSVFNIYRSMLHSLQAPEDFEFVLKGIVTLLNNVHNAESTLLPYSTKQVSCFQEILVLLWKLLDENKGFMVYMLRHPEQTCDIVVPMLYFMWSGRLHPAKVGLVHICTFILLLLSGERNFCVALNRPFAKKLPADLPLFHGTHIDLMVITLHKLVVNGSTRLSTLYNCFLTIISNASPYTKTLTMVASVKLMNLFELFASAKFLLKRPDHYGFVLQLVDTFNNIVQYQYEGNTQLVYSLVRRRHVVESLAALDIQEPVADAGAATAAAAGGGGGDASALSPDTADAAREEATKKADEEAAGHHNIQPHQEHQRSKRPRWTPTREWLMGWKSQMQLGTLLRLLNFLGPQVDDFVKSQSGTPDDTTVVAFLKETTMVGLLPVPHPILTRRYSPNAHTTTWFSTFLWGVVFLRNQIIPVFDSDRIKLFSITLVE